MIRVVHLKLSSKRNLNSITSVAINTYGLANSDIQSAIKKNILIPQRKISPSTQLDQYNIIYKKIPGAVVVTRKNNREFMINNEYSKVFNSLKNHRKAFVTTYSHKLKSWVTIYTFLKTAPGFFPILYMALSIQLFIVILFIIAFYYGHKMIIKNLLKTFSKNNDNINLKMPFPILATKTLQELYDKVSYLSYEKTIILSSLSHDVKNTLTKLMLLSVELDNETLQAEIEDEVRDVELIIESSLSFANGKSQKYTRAFNIHEYIENIHQYLLDRGFKFTFHHTMLTNQVIRGYPALLKRAIENIVSNATKYAQNTSISTYTNEHNKAVIEIADEGPGIRNQSIEKILNPIARKSFYEKNNIDSKGIGLAIAKTAIEYNNAELFVKNTKTGLLVTIIFSGTVTDP